MVINDDVITKVAERLQNMGLLGEVYTLRDVLKALEKIHFVSNSDNSVED